MSEEYAGCGQKAGLELWRIENFKLVKLEVNGKFHSGDSYVLLSTKKSEGKGWDLHFWLGEKTSQDEAGTAALKVVEIDEYLGGGPVQHREVQGNESSLFLSYFRRIGGIEYLPGGMSSGFRHAEVGVHRNRLLHIQGRHTVRVCEVSVSNKCLSNNDVFILDAGMFVYLYNGRKASTIEKTKAIDVANSIRVFNHQNLCGAQIKDDSEDQHAQPEIVRIIEEDPHCKGFWGLLGGEVEVRDVPEQPDNIRVQPAKLFCISDTESGKEQVQFSPVTIGPGGLVRSLLESTAVYVLDSGEGTLFVWVGAQASQTEKRSSFIFINKYITDEKLPHNTSAKRVVEGLETVDFKSLFTVWNSPPPLTQSAKHEVDAAVDVDVDALLAAHSEEEDKRLSASGVTDSQVTVWVIDSFEKLLLPADKHGMFFSGDSYIVLHQYKDGAGKLRYVIYFWIGDESSIDEKGTAALKAKEVAESVDARAPQVRVTQGKEPPSFRSLFHGLLVVMNGGRATGFHNLKAQTRDTAGATLPALFHIKGVGNDTHGIQVAATSSSLNSRDAFLLATVGSMFVWKGVYSSVAERALASRLAQRMMTHYGDADYSEFAIVEVMEREEPQGFWDALGGKEEYAETRAGDPEPRDARLFHIIDPTISKASLVEEITQFEQEDLLEADTFILDCFNELYLWIGFQSTSDERGRAERVAQSIVSGAKDGRGAVPIIQIQSGHEPLAFTSQFESWDFEYAAKHQYVDAYAKRMEALENEKKARADAKTAALQAMQAKNTAARLAGIAKLELHGAAAASTPVAADDPPTAPSPPVMSPLDGEKVHPIDMLKRSASTLPPGVDPAHKENSLSDEDFLTTFKITRSEFTALAQWKKDKLKKDVGLF